jgi:hypothetical protein
MNLENPVTAEHAGPLSRALFSPLADLQRRFFGSACLTFSHRSLTGVPRATGQTRCRGAKESGHLTNV